MPVLKIGTPNWKELVGGSTEVSWIADRDRKLALADETARLIRQTAGQLKARGALFKCDADLLRGIPFAADWYVSLAGYSLKTLGNIETGPQRFGLTRSVKNLVEGLRVAPGRASDEELGALARWLNAEIGKVYPKEARDELDALLRVALILGGRIIGQGQNIGGNEAVVIVKSLLADGLGELGDFEVEAGGEWKKFGGHPNLALARRLRFAGRLVCEFIGGGDRPDILIRINDQVVAVGEIKGRKDLSNVWESWMPQVADHMRTWSEEYPDALRLFFGTVITEEMVKGKSARGTGRTGLVLLHKQGLLSSAYNVSQTLLGAMPANRAFRELTTRLAGLLR